MNASIRRAGLVVVVAAFAATGACSRSSSTADPALKADLAAAVSTQSQPQFAISPLEATPGATAERSAPKRTPQRSAHPTVRVADRDTPAPVAAAKPQPDVIPAPAVEKSPEPATEPAAQPARAPAPSQRQPGVYKSEGEIFRQMPWIRP